MSADIEHYIDRQISWSKSTFGPGMRTEGILKHIEKEMQEVRDIPVDLSEWVDIIILAIDGAWRAGYSSEEIWSEMLEKQVINFARNWPPPPAQDEPSLHMGE